MERNRIPFLGLQFDNLDKHEVLNRVEQFIHDKKNCMIFTPNAALLVWSQKDQFLREVYNSSDILTVDGMAIYYAMHIMGTPVKESLSASLLFYPILELSQQKGYGIYLVGAKEEILQKTVDNICEQYSGIQISGYHHGYFDPENPPEELIQDIQDKKPDILLIGMSSPHKEKFVVSNMDKMNVPVSLGVGGMFDIAAGVTKFAPEWMRMMCLEWFYRLIQEPRRMWKRYLTTNSIFLWLCLNAFIKKYLLFSRTDQ